MPCLGWISGWAKELFGAQPPRSLIKILNELSAMQEGALLLRPKSGSNRIETPTRLLSVCQAINKQPIDINKSQRLQQMKTMMMTTRQVVRGPLPDARRRDRYRTALHSSDPSPAEGPKGMSAVLEKAEKKQQRNQHTLHRTKNWNSCIQNEEQQDEK